MILIFLAGLLLVSGCGREQEETPDVVATTAIAADITRHIAEPDMDVRQLVPGSASPHEYSASAEDRAELEDAKVVVAWGAGLEEGLPLEDLEPAPFEFAAGKDDPHVWMDPTLIAQALPRLVRVLGDADPEHRDAYRQRASDYAAELTALDEELRTALDSVPPERRKLVTSHDALGHFVARYDFEFAGAPFGTTPEAEASAEKVADLIQQVKDEDVPAVFAEDTDDPKLMRQIADEAGVEIVDDLLVEGFGSGHETYEDILRYDVQRIADALAP